MPRVIAANRIPRVNLVNRGINARPSDASAAAGQFRVPGDMTIATALPSIPGQTWQDGTVYPGVLKVSDYPVLFANQGPLNSTITQNAQAANAANYSQNYSVAWNGAFYANNGGNTVRKKSLAFGPYGATLFTGPGVVYNIFTFTGPLGPAGSRLFICGNDGGSATFGTIKTVTDDTTATANVNVGADPSASGLAPWAAFDTEVANTFIALCFNGGPILRTTNGGTSWAQITSTLSTPAVRVWCGIWRNLVSGAIHMIGQAMAIATSTDQGVTWTVNAAVPNASPVINTVAVAGGYNRAPNVAFDWVRRKGYALDSNGALKSWDLDNPTVGFTTVLANGSFFAGGLWFYTSQGIWTGANYNQTPKPGFWFAPFSDPTNWKQAFPLASIPTPTPPNPIIQSNIVSIIEQLGLVVFDNGVGAGASFPANFSIADGVTTFDRWTVADPGFAGGRKPYIRVL